MLNKIKERLFGIKPKVNKLEPKGILKTIVPSHFPDGKKASEVYWDSHLFINKQFVN